MCGGRICPPFWSVVDDLLDGFLAHGIDSGDVGYGLARGVDVPDDCIALALICFQVFLQGVDHGSIDTAGLGGQLVGHI